MNTYKLLTPGPLTTTDTVKEEMLVDRCTWDDDYKAVTQKIRRQLLGMDASNLDARLNFPGETPVQSHVVSISCRSSQFRPRRTRACSAEGHDRTYIAVVIPMWTALWITLVPAVTASCRRRPSRAVAPDTAPPCA